MIESQTLTTTLASIESSSIPEVGVALTNVPSLKAGQYVPRADTKQPPTFTSKNLDSSKTYLIACLDLDAPFISFSVMAPILHFLQLGAKVSGESLTFSEEAVASWHPAGPPPGAAPHRYVFLVYDEPSNFDSAKCRKEGGYGIGDRIRFRWDEFEKENGLGKPVAANYFKSN